ncbi:MAG TPA: hypothetical protein VGG64_21280 [Pirellulales bacterium]
MATRPNRSPGPSDSSTWTDQSSVFSAERLSGGHPTGHLATICVLVHGACGSGIMLESLGAEMLGI